MMKGLQGWKIKPSQRSVENLRDGLYRQLPISCKRSLWLPIKDDSVQLRERDDLAIGEVDEYRGVFAIVQF